MILPIRVLLPLILLLIFVASPGFVKAPTQENIERLTITQDSYIVPITNPSFPIKTQALGMSIDDEIMSYNWDWDIAYKIMSCESGGNPEAIGDTNTKYHSYGLFQIRNLPSRNYNIEELFNPERNIEIAYEIYKQDGWLAWRRCYLELN